MRRSRLQGIAPGGTQQTYQALNAKQKKDVQVIGFAVYNNTKVSAGNDDNMYAAYTLLIWDIANGPRLPPTAASSWINPATLTSTGDINAATVKSDMDFLIQQYNTLVKVPAFNPAT